MPVAPHSFCFVIHFAPYREEQNHAATSSQPKPFHFLRGAFSSTRARFLARKNKTPIPSATGSDTPTTATTTPMTLFNPSSDHSLRKMPSWLFACVFPKALTVLILLTFQNCAVALFLRYTRTRTDVPKAHIGCVVMLQELLKFLISAVWCVHEVKSTLSYHPPPPPPLARNVSSSVGVTVGGGASCETSIIAGDVRSQFTIAVREVNSAATQLSNDVTSASSSSSIVFSTTSHHQGQLQQLHHDEEEETSDDRGRPMTYRDVMTKSSCRAALLHAVAADVFNRQGLKLLIPSGLFSLQNTLLFVAMTNLEPTTFLVLYQSKILTTGILMVILLGRSFSPQKWFAMIVLLSGIVLTQYNPNGKNKIPAPGESLSTGLMAVLFCSLSSSIAGVVMEKFMKDGATSTAISPSTLSGSGIGSHLSPSSPPSVVYNSHLSTKNVHLSFFSMMLVGIPVVFGIWSGADDVFVSVFHGVDEVVCAMIVNQALGGILVALCLRHADNILKTFATTCAIVVGGVVSHFLFGFVPSASFVLGSLTVMGAIVLYGMPDVC